MPTKKSKNAKASITLTREDIKVTQSPADTSGSTVSQLTRYEYPMKKAIGTVKGVGKSRPKSKPSSGYGRIDF